MSAISLNTTATKTDVEQAMDDFRVNINNEEFSDFTIEVKGKALFAHKAILASRSPYFARMLRIDMKEKRENKVVIDDFEPHVIEEMLEFIYTGTSPKLTSMADKLLPAADKYELFRLKSLCEDAIVVTNENCIKTLLMADQNSAEKLERKAIEYFAANHAKIRTAFPNEYWIFIMTYRY